MRRVVHLLGASAGGIRRHVRYLATHPPPGWHTEAVCGPADLAGYFAGLPFRPLGRLGSLHPPATGDVMHVHGLTPAVYALRPARRPVVLTLHMDVRTQGRTARSGILRRLAPVLAGRADALVAVSERIARSFPAARVIAPASEPLGSPHRGRDEVRAALGAKDEDVVALTVARLHPDKGLDTFIAGVASAGAVGWIAGDGPARAQLERATTGTRVRLLGYRDDIPDLLGAADVFALPSVGEGYGIAVVEALQAGLPVVATDAGAMPELVADAGLLVPPGDRGAFARAMGRMVEEPDLRTTLAARARARDLPTPQELVAAVGAVYDEVSR